MPILRNTMKHRRPRSLHRGFTVTLLALVWISTTTLLPPPADAQDTSRTVAVLRTIANAIVQHDAFRFIDSSSGKSYTNAADAPRQARLELASPFADWRYWNGVINIGLMRLATLLHAPQYFDYVAQDMSFTFDQGPSFAGRSSHEGKYSFPFGQFLVMQELDDCGSMGASLIGVYRKDKQPRYRAYLDSAADFTLHRLWRNDDSSFVRPGPVRWTMWADDLYMSVSLLSRMGALTGEHRYFDESARQVLNFHKHLFDETNGLMYHNWYSDVDRHGAAFWGRANGWAILAQIDLLDHLPASHPLRGKLLAMFQRHILGIARYQGPSGLWHQLLDKNDSFEETSCSAMFTYAIARAVNKGYLEERYLSIALKGWEGILGKIRDGGQLEGVCAGTGVSDDLVSYYHRPTPLNDPHGIGAVLLAGIEILSSKKP